MAEMISTKPYLIRAIREWAMDNGFTPELLVNAEMDGVEVPVDFIKEGQIVLNVHERALDAPLFDNENIAFTARFGGVARNISVPTEAVLAIYARENLLGIFFQSDDEPEGGGTEEKSVPDAKVQSKKPSLRIVK